MTVDPFTYARDHQRGPGAWCVIGPDGFKVVCDDKGCAYMLGKLLSGRVDEAVKMAADYLVVL